MKSRNSIGSLLLLVLPLGFAGIWPLEHRIDAQRAALGVERDEMLLRSAKLVKAISLEYAPFVADVYWTRAVQYYGNKRIREETNFDLLWPLLDVTTTLDPQLLVAYRFGAVFLSQPPPAGAGRPDLAVQLIERGIRDNPLYWRLYEDLGFVYYFDKKDYSKASQAFLDGSKVAGAEIWMEVMAAKIAAQGESCETSFFLWKDIYDTAVNPMIKENALAHLKQLLLRPDCRQFAGALLGNASRGNR
jgi:hypothetical protein